jgi:hypothetical protein
MSVFEIGRGLVAASASGMIVYVADRRLYASVFPYKTWELLVRSSVRPEWTAICICFLGERLFMCVRDSSFVGCVFVWMSDDYGSTWTHNVRFDGTGEAYERHPAVVTASAAGGSVFLVFGDNVFKSADRGMTWTTVLSGDHDVRDLVVLDGSVRTLASFFDHLTSFVYDHVFAERSGDGSRRFLVGAAGRAYLCFSAKCIYAFPAVAPSSAPSAAAAAAASVEIVQSPADSAAWSAVNTSDLPYEWRESSVTIPIALVDHVAVLRPTRDAADSMVYVLDARDGTWTSANNCPFLRAACGLFLPGALVNFTGFVMTEEADAAEADTLDLYSRSPAHAAAAENRLDDVCAAIECGTKMMTHPDLFGKTPLQYVESDMASMEKIVRFVILLLQSPCMDSELLRGGRTLPLMAAKTLCGGRTLLHWVVSTANTELLDAIQSGRSQDISHASLTLWDAVDENGSTPLHIACETGRLDIVAKLIKYNANRTIVDKRGRIPLQLLPPHLLEVLRMSM